MDYELMKNANTDFIISLKVNILVFLILRYKCKVAL